MRWGRRTLTSCRYEVTVRRRGASPLVTALLVGADSPERAVGVAVAVAERDRGGTFEAARVRRIARLPSVTVDEEAYY